MSSKKKNQLTTSSEWAKHLRKIGKRFFWKGERLAEKGMIKKEKDIITELLPEEEKKRMESKIPTGYNFEYQLFSLRLKNLIVLSRPSLKLIFALKPNSFFALEISGHLLATDPG